MDFLLDHIELLSGRIETFKAHQATASALVATARSELAVEVSAAKKQPPTPGRNVSPTRRRRKSSGHHRPGGGSSASPVRPRTTATGHRRRSSGTAHTDVPPLEQLLQNLAILLPHQQDDDEAAAAAATATDGPAQVAFLSATLDERSAKAADVARSVQEAFESAAAAQLADAKRAVRMARESVLAESPFGEVKLIDPEIEGSIAVLAQEVKKVDTKLESVERDSDKARGRSVKRDELILRWA